MLCTFFTSTMKNDDCLQLYFAQDKVLISQTSK